MAVIEEIMNPEQAQQQAQQAPNPGEQRPAPPQLYTHAQVEAWLQEAHTQAEEERKKLLDEGNYFINTIMTQKREVEQELARLRKANEELMAKTGQAQAAQGSGTRTQSTAMETADADVIVVADARNRQISLSSAGPLKSRAARIRSLNPTFRVTCLGCLVNRGGRPVSRCRNPSSVNEFTCHSHHRQAAQFFSRSEFKKYANLARTTESASSRDDLVDKLHQMLWDAIVETLEPRRTTQRDKTLDSLVDKFYDLEEESYRDEEH